MALLTFGFAASLVIVPAASSEAPPCLRFDEIYAGGKELCENMWNDAFVYEEDEAKAYTMWFFDQTNPNDAVSRNLGFLSGEHDVCHLDYFHKDEPGPEPESFTECHPWKNNACCIHDTVETATKLKEGYGAEFHWDRCGPLTPECERFFVQEACFYECDPNAGLFRKWDTNVYDPRCDAYHADYDEAHATAQDCSHNTWQMHKMPIKASYCDAWFTACKTDQFCAAAGGDFFTCAKAYEAVDDAKVLLEAQNAAQNAELERLEAERDRLNTEVDDLKKDNDNTVTVKDEGLNPMVMSLIIVLGAITVLALCGAVYLVRMEKSGKPVFGKLPEEVADKGQNHQADDGVSGADANTVGNTA